MRRIALAATLALFSLGSVATANAQSRSCGQNNQAVGGIVGALVGGTAGGLITNNRRSFRRGSSFRRGFGGRRSFRRNNNGVGIAIGAIAGGIIGSQVAGARSRDCQTAHNRRSNGTPFGATSQQRSNSAPFGGQDPYSTQPASAPVASAPPPLSPPPANGQSTSGIFQPVCQFVTQTTELPNGQRSSEQVEVCQFSPNGEWIPR